MILSERLQSAGGLQGLTIADRRSSTTLAGALAARRDSALAERLHGRSVLLATGGQHAAALAMIAIDGLARRMVLVPPGLNAEQTASILKDAEIDVCVTDDAFPHGEALAGVPTIDAAQAATAGAAGLAPQATEWVLATSGTTGNPKLVAHTLEGLAGGINTSASPSPAPSGAPSTTFAAMAACRSSCGRCSDRRRSFSRIPTSRCATSCSASDGPRSPISSARPRTGAWR